VKVPQPTGRAAASIKARGRASGGSIAFGGSKAEYFPWLNFGGRVGRNRRIERARVEPDRYIYTTISEKKGDTEAAIDKALKEVLDGAGFERKGF
jgi:phage gpG-like protein